MVFIKIVIGFVCFAFLLASIVIAVAIIAILVGEPYSPVLTGMNISSDAYIVMVLFAILIPLVLLIYSLGATLFNVRVRKAVSLPVSILWIVLVVFLSVITVRNHQVLRESINDWKQDWRHFDQNRYDAKFFDAPDSVVIDADTIIDNNNRNNNFDVRYFDYDDTDNKTINKTE